MTRVFPVLLIFSMSNLLTADIIRLFYPQAKDTLIITVGNHLRSDDGVGPYIADCYKEKGSFTLIDAGFSPERIIEQAKELFPKKIIVIDAANFGGIPGESRIIPQETLEEVSLSTHTIPMSVIARLISEDTGAEVFFLGIQPKTVNFGEGLSPEVKKTADVIVKLLNVS